MNRPPPVFRARKRLRIASAIALAFAAGTLALASASARTDALPSVTISAPAVRDETHGWTTGAPIERVTIKARVHFQPVTLTTYSGVALLKDAVADAARKGCLAIEATHASESCVRRAIASAKPQIAAAIAQARRAEAG